MNGLTDLFKFSGIGIFGMIVASLSLSLSLSAQRSVLIKFFLLLHAPALFYKHKKPASCGAGFTALKPGFRPRIA